MRFLHYRQPRRALASSLPLVALSTLCGLLSAPSFAQDLFVTADATIAGGNPVNGDYGQIIIGADALNTSYPNITADITGGSSTGVVAATNSSLVTISAGTFGKESTPGTSYRVLYVLKNSTLNLTGGTLRGFATIGNPFSNDGTLSTFNMSGGMAPYIENSSVARVADLAPEPSRPTY